MSLYDLQVQAQKGNPDAVEQIVQRFHPLLVTKSIRNNKYDEDCYQECVLALLEAIPKFEIRNDCLDK